MTLDRDLLDAFVPEFEAEAVRLAMVRDAASGARALDQLRAMAAVLGAASLSAMTERAAAALDPLDLAALHRAAEALARRARLVAAAGTDVALPDDAPAGPQPEAAPPMPGIDADIIEAFAAEFAPACDRLAAAPDASAASHAAEMLRGMAGAAGFASLRAMLERAGPLLDPFDRAGLASLAAALRDQAARIIEAGRDLPPLAEADTAAPEPELPDPELLAAFLPEFEAACTRLAGAADAAAATRAVDLLHAMAASLPLASLCGMQRDAVPDPFDPAAMPPLARALAEQARAIAAGGRDIAPAPQARRRVLVVDDSPMMRRLVREILALDPVFEVVGEAADGRAALRAMAELKPDLTMLDIEMPELDGIGVLRSWALRGPGAVVIVSSAARPGSATAILVRGLGAAGIVGKPSGALSPDLRQRQGETLLHLARSAVGLGTRHAAGMAA